MADLIAPTGIAVLTPAMPSSVDPRCDGLVLMPNHVLRSFTRGPVPVMKVPLMLPIAKHTAAAVMSTRPRRMNAGSVRATRANSRRQAVRCS